MSYLSRIWINPLRRQSQRLLRSAQAMHAAVLGGLPVAKVDERVLWRLDADSPHRLALYVQTVTRPSWEHLVEQAGWPSAENSEAMAEVRHYEPLLRRLQKGQEYAFRLTANPTSSTRHPDKPSSAQQVRREGGTSRSVRVGHRTASAQLKWLVDRAEGGQWGFEIPEVQLDGGWPTAHAVDIVSRERKVFSRNTDAPAQRTKQKVTIQVVTFEGRLRVTEANLLRRSMLAGLGRAKAYGCGLITLAPLVATPGAS